ncbi:amino acid permease, partial [bacterium]|nr:amino acid permease [bacterium]
MSKQGQISVFTAILLSMNVMVGTGILFSPSIMAAKAGNASFLAWPLTALIFLPAVFGVSQISKLIPETGGVYIYSTKILGRFAGFVTGMLSIVGYTLATATVVSALRIAMAQNFPTVIMFQSPVAFGIMAIASICMFNLISTQAFGKIQGPATIVKLIPIFLLIAFLPLITRRWLPIVAPDAMSLPSSLTLAIFSYFGFEYACNIGHHLPNKRDISKVIFLAFGGTALIYTLFHFGLLQL